MNIKEEIEFLENYNENLTIKQVKNTLSDRLYQMGNESVKENNTKEVQTKLVEELKKESKEECCSVCKITKSVYGFTFDTNEKNELTCMNCWGKNLKC